MYPRHSLTMAAFAYQALRYYRTGRLSLPPGYRLAGIVENPALPRFGFVAESAERIVVSFRGTEDWTDLKKDLEVAQIPYPYVRGGGWTHKGFTLLYGSVREQVLSMLRRIPRGKSLYLTGHSLGGALASLCALELAESKRFPVFLHTFGAPKAGNPAFASAVSAKARAFRYYNPLDPVPALPPDTFLIYHYAHAGRPVPIPFDRLNPFSNHSMAGYFQALCLRLPRDCRSLCRRAEGLCP